jgi:hypothetical protein
VRVWTQDQAAALTPYLKSIVGSLRESKLQAQRSRLEAKRLDEKPGRLGRDEIIAREDALRDAHKAELEHDAAVAELESLDVYTLDPLAGQLLVPTVHDDQLAWFVYDHFDERPLRSWRYHTDPIDTRRPLSELRRARAEKLA